MGSIRVVWQSPLIPFGPHAVRSDVPDDLKARLKTALAAMAAMSPAALDAVDRSSIGGGGFADVATSDYAVIADLIGVSLTPPAGVSAASPVVELERRLRMILAARTPRRILTPSRPSCTRRGPPMCG